MRYPPRPSSAMGDGARSRHGVLLGGIFLGAKTFLGPEGQPTGINKTRCDGIIDVSRNGLVGDFHGDPKIHGGPEKAVHHYAAEHYDRLADRYPRQVEKFAPGSLGENFTTTGMTEREVCIGDVYAVGSAILQVSQPRSPCWKINHKFAIESMSRFIQDTRITGWYYRVVTEGRVETGDLITLLERPNDAVTLVRFMTTTLDHRPRLDKLSSLLDLAALSPEWKRRIAQRLDWLKKHR